MECLDYVVILAIYLDNRFLEPKETDFVQLVTSDVAYYLKTADINRVLIFPPVESYYRLLIHRTVQETFADLCSFSVGEGDDRRTVVCLKQSILRAILTESDTQLYEILPEAIANVRRAVAMSEDRWDHGGWEDSNQSRPKSLGRGRGRGRARRENRYETTPTLGKANNEKYDGGMYSDRYESKMYSDRCEPEEKSPSSHVKRSVPQNMERDHNRTKQSKQDAQVYIPRARRQPLDDEKDSTKTQMKKCDHIVEERKNISAKSDNSSGKSPKGRKPRASIEVYVPRAKRMQMESRIEEIKSTAEPDVSNQTWEEEQMLYDTGLIEHVTTLVSVEDVNIIKEQVLDFGGEKSKHKIEKEYGVKINISNSGEHKTKHKKSHSKERKSEKLHESEIESHSKEVHRHKRHRSKEYKRERKNSEDVKNNQNENRGQSTLNSNRVEPMEFQAINTEDRIVKPYSVSPVQSEPDIHKTETSECHKDNKICDSSVNNEVNIEIPEIQQKCKFSENVPSRLLDSNRENDQNATGLKMVESISVKGTDELEHSLACEEMNISIAKQDEEENSQASKEKKMCVLINSEEDNDNFFDCQTDVDNINDASKHSTLIQSELCVASENCSVDKTADPKCEINFDSNEIETAKSIVTNSKAEVSENECFLNSENVIINSSVIGNEEHVDKNSETEKNMTHNSMAASSSINILVSNKQSNDTSENDSATMTPNSMAASSSINILASNEQSNDTSGNDSATITLNSMAASSSKNILASNEQSNDTSQNESALTEENKAKTENKTVFVKENNFKTVSNSDNWMETDKPKCNDINNIVSIEEKSGEANEDGDSWDALFDDDGEALDPKILDELTVAVGKVKVTKTQFDYYSYQPKDPDMDYEAYSHLIEIYDFSKELETRDLVMAFMEFKDKGFEIKWVDDTHAIGVFSSTIAANSALCLKHPLMKVCPISQASRQSKVKAKKSCEFLQPYKHRPETVASVARNMVAGALGLQTNVPKEKRDEERRKLKEAREQKKASRKQKQAAWDGSYGGKCAMDEN